MKKRNVFFSTLVFVFVVSLGMVGLSQARGQDSAGLNLVSAPSVALGTAFTYQGYMTDGGVPADDRYDFKFSLYDAASDGGPVGSVVSREDVPVSEGVFIVQLDFGDIFDGTALWLQVGVREWDSAGAYTSLSPRQALTASPYALYALKVANHDHWGETWTGTGTGLTLSGDSTGLSGESTGTDGRGVHGLASATTGTNYGVYGESNSPVGRGVYGIATTTSGTNYGVYGQTDSTNGVGVAGFQTGYDISDISVNFKPGGLFGGKNGVIGISKVSDGFGVFGWARSSSGTGAGVYGIVESTSGLGVAGFAQAVSGTTYGLYGKSASPDGRGVYGLATTSSGTNYGVYGETNSPDGYAGYFDGDVNVTGDFTASSKSFKIDHPLDPANQYLYHFSVESSEHINQYTGNVVLDGNGEAWVELPDWFQTINTDFRYQLTCIGGFAPVYIAREIEGNRFQIAGGEPGMKVSWLVAALRDDPYIQQYPQAVEVDKPEGEVGTYLYPELYGQPEELDRDYHPDEDLVGQ
jgi:hypothetical protein